jgi:hypothetical protein
MFSSISHENQIILHFYAQEVKLEEFIQIEKRSLDSHDYGGEVMGLIRPVLYELPRDRGFQIFLQNQFVGNSLFQMLRSIVHFKILSVNEIIHFIDKC